jgi:HNH endonuclease
VAVPLSASACWDWTGGITGNGYGYIYLDGRGTPRVAAHRVAYELLVGPIPPGLQIDHLCRNRRCVNPLHLEVVTQTENVRRGANHWRNLTHCKYGHPLDGWSAGRRYCRECTRRRNREHMRRVRAAV